MSENLETNTMTFQLFMLLEQKQLRDTSDYCVSCHRPEILD